MTHMRAWGNRVVDGEKKQNIGLNIYILVIYRALAVLI